MTRKRWNFLSRLIIVTIIFMNSAGIAKSLPEISSNSDSQNSKPLYFGYLPDAYPISYGEGYGDRGLSVKTFCGELYNHLINEYKYPISPQVIDYQHKFTRTLDNGILLNISCGPYTITPDRKTKLQESGAAIPNSE